MKNKTTAALLAFFLGPFGVHRFYLGEAGLGITYLLVSTVLGPFLLFIPTAIIGLVNFVEFIIFLTMSDEEFDLKYNKGASPVVQQQFIAVPPPPANPAPVPPVPTPVETSSKAEQLTDLKKLLDDGILTQEEFDAEKKKILDA